MIVEFNTKEMNFLPIIKVIPQGKKILKSEAMHSILNFKTTLLPEKESLNQGKIKGSGVLTKERVISWETEKLWTIKFRLF